MDRCNEEEPARDDLMDGVAMTGPRRDVAAPSGSWGASLPDQERSGDQMSVALPKVGIEGMRFPIGPQNEWEATLPLSSTLEFLATSQQRVRIGRAALDTILAEDPQNRRLGFSRLREEIIRRTGLLDAAVSLVIFAREGDLEET
jgi:hypothetical protein